MRSIRTSWFCTKKYDIITSGGDSAVHTKAASLGRFSAATYKAYYERR